MKYVSFLQKFINRFFPGFRHPAFKNLQFVFRLRCCVEYNLFIFQLCGKLTSFFFRRKVYGANWTLLFAACLKKPHNSSNFSRQTSFYRLSLRICRLRAYSKLRSFPACTLLLVNFLIPRHLFSRNPVICFSTYSFNQLLMSSKTITPADSRQVPF